MIQNHEDLRTELATHSTGSNSISPKTSEKNGITIEISNEILLQNQGERQDEPVVPERKKKRPPDQLPFIRLLLIINFLGFVLIIAHTSILYCLLFTKSHLFNLALFIISVFSDSCFVLSWGIFFVSALKRKITALKISIFLSILSIILKLIFVIINGGENGLQDKSRQTLVAISLIFLIFETFSSWSQFIVLKKMDSMPEKNWKKAFRRPKGKYMYAQD